MKILELEICDVRGILHLSIEPNGRNVVILGLNGSGKSAVVDAIDFLLTGRISRLMGEGTAEISLSKHGAHIDHKPEDATVRAKIKLPGVEDTIEIKRCIGNPNDIEITCDERVKEYVEFVLWIAKRGQHVLTRGEILKYITAESGSRAKRIQTLLNVSDIEDIRSALVTVRNKADVAHRASQQSVIAAKGLVIATAAEKTYAEEQILEFVNRNRAVLDGKAISVIRSKDIQSGIRKPADSSEIRTINVVLVERDIQNLRNVISIDSQDEIGKSDEQIRKLITDVKSDPELKRTFSRLQLAEMGVGLIEEDGSCPLCDIGWPVEKLREHLERKISTAKEIAQQYDIIKRLSSSISSRVSSTIASMQKVIEAANSVGLEEERVVLQSWRDTLGELLNSVSFSLEKYPDDRFSSELVKRMLAPNDIEKSVSIIHEAIKSKIPEVTPELNAWDALTRIGENLKALEKAAEELRESELYLSRASVLRDSFENARDSILGRLYHDIRDRFVYIYRELHELDEGKFTAIIEPVGAGLDLEVDFHGRGNHPPHALHSEGHQDSMGLCLYLALAERLNKDIINLIILDDVVMSVDVEHRRQICTLLAKEFPERQFIITTHDKTWANQLRSEGIVRSRDLIEFHNWSIEAGPQINYDVILWYKIVESLDRNDVPTAAGELRRGLESYFAEVCDSLEGAVKYNLNHRWEFGDFLKAAMKQYGELIRKAKRSANSWGNQGAVEKLAEKERMVGQIYVRTNAEQWAVDANVHYNNWTNFVKEDFEPVVSAFKDLCSVYTCTQCESMLKVTSINDTPVGIRCKCQEEDWNLVEREK